MNAYRVILNHFSQRYPTDPVLEPSFGASTIFSFDMMHVDFMDLERLPNLLASVSNKLPKFMNPVEDDEEEQILMASTFL